MNEASALTTVKAISADFSCSILTDFDGNFIFSNLNSGTYEIQFIDDGGNTTYYNTRIQIEEGNANPFNIHQTINSLRQLIVCYFQDPIQVPENPVMKRECLQRSVNKLQLPEMISGMSSEFTLNNQNELQFQGSRNDDYLQLIDGVKTLEFNKIPAGALRNIMIYNGFIPAKYGDTNGAV